MEEDRNDNHEREEGKKVKEVKYVTRRTFFVCFAVLLAAIIWTGNSVKDEIQWMSNNHSNQMTMLENEIEHIPSGIEYVLEQADYPFREVYINMTDVDIKAKEATVSLTAMPKEYKEGMKVIFYLSCDESERIAVEGVADEDRTYHAEKVIPFCDVVTATAVLQRDGVEYLQNAGSQAINNEVLPEFIGHWSSVVSTVIGKQGTATMCGDVLMDVIVPGWMRRDDEYTRFKLSDAKAELYADGKLKKTIPMIKDSVDAIHFSYIGHLEEKDAITLKDGQEVEILFKATDNYGAKYTYVLERGSWSKQGGYMAEEPVSNADTRVGDRLTVE